MQSKFDGPAPPYQALTNLENMGSSSGYPTNAVTQELSTITVTQPQLIAVPPVGPKSQRMQCYNCKCQVSSTVITKANMKSHAMCLALCPLSVLCCCFIPYCFDSCKSQHHYCPSCNTYLGTFSN